MAHEHPRGAGPWVGHQLRYLVGSAHGWLGGVGFAASARRLQARDGIGWDARGAATNCTGWWDCAADPPRGVAATWLRTSWVGWCGQWARTSRRYGYRPWLLETFVDEREHTGASWRAANWVRLGETAGRGRQDRTHATAKTRKAVYMYELETASRIGPAKRNHRQRPPAG